MEKGDYSALLSKESRPSEEETESSTTDDGFQGYVMKGRQTRSDIWKRRMVIGGLGFIIIAYFVGSLSFMVMMYRQGRYQLRTPEPPYSPANDVLKYILQPGAAYDQLMAGEPSQEHDKAWLDFVTPALIRASYEEMVLGGEDPKVSVEMARGGGYMTSLGVFHEMHCLRRMKLWIYKDHYYSNLPEKEIKYEQGHLSHCIEAIRQSLMCAGNPTLYSFQFEEGHMRKPKATTGGYRTCIDWKRLEAWSKERGVGLQPGLKPPRHKPATDGHADHMEHDAHKEHEGHEGHKGHDDQNGHEGHASQESA